MEQIEDGTGKGFVAEVTSENQLSTSATIQTKEHVTSVKGDSYFASNSQAGAANTLSISAVGGPVLILENNETGKDLIISKILASTNTNGTEMRWSRNPNLSALGNNTSIVPSNSNHGSSKKANVSANIWDEVGDGITGSVETQSIMSWTLAIGPFIYPIDGTIVIPSGGIFQVDMKGLSESTIGVRFYFAPEKK